jgi:hypothetical protein
VSPAHFPTAPSRAATPPRTNPRVIDALWTFGELHSKPLDDSYTSSNGDYLVRNDGRIVVVTRVGSAQPIIEHVATAGFRAEDVYIQGPWLVVKELSANDASAEIDLQRYDLNSGERIHVTKRDVPRPTEPEMDFLGDHLYYVTGSSTTHKCLIDLDIERLIAKRSYCGESGWVVEDPKASPAGLVVSEVHPDPESRCKRLVVIPLGEKPRRDLAPPVTTCRQWSGYLVEGAVAWDEIDPTERDVDMGEADLYARTSRGELVDLGAEYTDSLIACAGWFYWNVQGEEELRRWRPGSDIEVIFRAPDGGGTVLGRAACGTERLILRVNATDPDRTRETLYSAELRS